MSLRQGSKASIQGRADLEYGKSEFRVSQEKVFDEQPAPNTALRRDLKSRHVTMIAIGGAVGTGLVIGTGAALAKAGPGSILISYSFVGVIVWLVMTGLGEMATWIPDGKNFAGYASRFVDPALGFATGYTYWVKYLMTTPNQLTATALVLQYWVSPTKVNPGIFIAIFLVAIVAINYFGVKFFGEFEFWLSGIKVVIVVGLIILTMILALGGGPDHDRKGFRYWKDPGAFRPYLKPGKTGQFLGFWSSLITAVFAYLSTELVGVTVGEAQNPRKTIPKAMKLTFYRIFFFYVLSVLFLGMNVPWNSPELAFATKQGDKASASPFVVSIYLAGIKVLPGLINGCILLFVFSAANSDLYIATRTIYGLAKDGKAPAFLAKTNKNGVPVNALLSCALFCLLAFMNVSNDSRVVFGYFVNITTILGLLTWISLLVSHVGFVRARNAQGVPPESLAYRAPLGIRGSYVAIFFCAIIALTKNYTVFIPNPETYGKFDFQNFITGYLGIPFYLSLILGYKLWKGEPRVSPKTADLYSGKDAIDREEAEFIAEQAAKVKVQKKGGWFYKYFLAWLF